MTLGKRAAPSRAADHTGHEDHIPGNVPKMAPPSLDRLTLNDERGAHRTKVAPRNHHRQWQRLSLLTSPPNINTARNTGDA